MSVFTTSVVLPASRHAVYRAWLDPALIAQWMAPNGAELSRVEVDERRDGHWRTWVAEAGTITDGHDAELVQLVPDRLIVWRWGLVGPQGRAGRSADTRLVVSLEDEPGGGTRLRLDHDGLERLAAQTPEAARLESDWKHRLEQLLRLLAASPTPWEEEEERLLARAVQTGDPTGWFEELYAAGASGRVEVAWSRAAPHPLLAAWTAEHRIDGTGQTAVVVGCALGADAEHLADLGFATTAFDIAPTAIDLARCRHPHTQVRYLTADLLDPPAAWHHAFDLVVEIITVQALPTSYRPRAITNISRFVAPGGRLLVAAAIDDGATRARLAEPLPLTAADIAAFAADGLVTLTVEQRAVPGRDHQRRWWAELTRPHRSSRG